MKCLFILVVILSPVVLCAQISDQELINFTNKNGLPSNETYILFKDSKNYMWVGTDQGVVRFDGKEFKKFPLPDNVIFKIREDNKGRIWFFSYTGKLAYLENEKIKLYKYNNKIDSIPGSDLVVDAVIHSDNSISNSGFYSNYEFSNTGKINVIPNGAKLNVDSTVFEINCYENKICFTRKLMLSNQKSIFVKLRSNKITRTYLLPYNLSQTGQFGSQTNDGRNFYFYVDNLVAFLDENGSIITRTFDSRVLSIKVLPDGKVWVGLMNNGCVLLDNKLSSKLQNSALSLKSVSSIVEDNEGGLWFSTLENGVYFLKNQFIKSLKFTDTISHNISRLYPLNNQDLLFANPNGIYKYSNGEAVSIQYLSNRKINDLKILRNTLLVGGAFHSVLEQSNYSVPTNKSSRWNIKLIESTGNFRLSNKTIYSYYGINFLNLHYSSTANDLKITNRSYTEFTFKPTFLFQDHASDIWIGSLKGLHRWDHITGDLYPVSSTTKMFSKGTTCMTQIQNGVIAIGLRFGGVALYMNNILQAVVTESNGLVSNSTQSMISRKNEIWVTTAKGVGCIKVKSLKPFTYEIENLGENLGIENELISQTIFWGDHLLLATNKGILTIDLPGFSKFKTKNFLPFYINSIRYSGIDTSGISRIELPYKNSAVTIEYSAISYNDANDVKYFFRFSNKTDKWTEIEGREFQLQNLAPGMYDLELQAVAKVQDRQSQIKRLTIRVFPPWWRTDLFVIIVCLLTGILIVLFYKWNVKSLLRKEKRKRDIQNQMQELKQVALRSQINPHFIFNCLTSIQQLIVSGKNSEANDYLVQFSQMIRKTLHLSDMNYVPIKEEVDYLQQYIALEQLRFPDQFDFQIQIDNKIHYNTLIPHMLLQPLLENAIKHGLTPLVDKKGLLLVEFLLNEDLIKCMITDNGIGLAAAFRSTGQADDQKSYGLTLVKDRLNILGNELGVQLHFEIKDLSSLDSDHPSGTRVEMDLPFKTKTL